MSFMDANGSYTDKTFTCLGCKQSFTFTIGEQKFFDEKQLATAPKRCKPCRDLNKAARQERDQRAANSAPAPQGDRGRSGQEHARGRRRDYDD